TPNPHIPWDRLAVKVVSERVPWPRGVSRRIAGVSSFGFSGTNAHVMLEEAPTVPLQRNDTNGSAPTPERSVHLLAISAPSPAALRDLAERHARFLEVQTEEELADVCYTANVCRSHFEHRLALLTASRQQASALLAEWAEGKVAAELRQGEARGRPKFAL